MNPAYMMYAPQSIRLRLWISILDGFTTYLPFREMDWFPRGFSTRIGARHPALARS